MAQSHCRGQGVNFLAIPAASCELPLFPIALMLIGGTGWSVNINPAQSMSDLPPQPVALPSTSPDQSTRPLAPITSLITMSELLAIVPFTRQHILRLEKRGRFPRRLRIGENRVVWLRYEIEDWINARAAERDQSYAAATPTP